MAAKEDPNALVAEVRAAGHIKTADKLAALAALHMVPEPGQHRELTADEVKLQQEQALSMYQLQAAQRVEYGTYVATEDIYAGAALAYAAGQPVPVSNVEQHGYGELGLVRRVAPEPTKAEPKSTVKPEAK
jgi:hypothetical protein